LELSETNNQQNGEIIMSVRTGLTIAVCSALLLASGWTLAADSGMYIGISLGQSFSTFDTASTIAAARAPAGTAVSPASSAFSYKEVFGYQFNQNFAAELSYTSLGKYDFTRTAPATAPATGKVTIGGFGIAGVGLFPVNKELAVFGKLGAFHSDISASTSVNLFHSGQTGSDSEHKWVPNYGIGLTYDINRTFGLRGEIERFQGMGSSTRTVKTDANLFTVGLSYKF